MKKIKINAYWKSVSIVEVPDDYEYTSGELDDEWVDEVDSAGAELVDWEVINV